MATTAKAVEAVQSVGDGPDMVTLAGGVEMSREDAIKYANDPFLHIHLDPNKYGIKPGFVPVFVRDERKWNKLGAVTERPREILNTYEGAYMPHTGDSDRVIVGEDLVCMAIPEDHIKAQQRVIDEKQIEQFIEGSEEVKDGDVGAVMRYEDKINRHSRADIDRMHQMHKDMGLIGGWSSKLDLVEAQKRALKDDPRITEGPNGEKWNAIDREEARWRPQGGHQTLSHNRFQEVMNPSRFAMGDTGFGRNPNSAVAQAASRDRSKKG